MDKDLFIEKVAAQFENIDAKEINESTCFKELDEWSSLIALYIIIMAEEEYNVALKREDIRDTNTVVDLYNLLQSKI